jgi:hypothetical protein
MRDREDFTHILGKRLAKALGIGRHWTPLVPLNGESLSNRLAAVCYADDSQCVAIGSQERRNDRHPLSSLREREKGVRLALGGDRWALVRHVYLPSVTAWVLSNLKIAVGFAFTGACVGEFVAATRGLGYLLSFAQSTYNSALMFALILLILVVVLVIFGVAERLEKYLLRWNRA